MRTRIYWIDLPMPGRLGIMGRPRSGEWLDDEVSGWRIDGIDLVISLLEADEVAELGLEKEGDLCKAEGIEFISFPIADRGVPASVAQMMVLAESVAATTPRV